MTNTETRTVYPESLQPGDVVTDIFNNDWHTLSTPLTVTEVNANPERQPSSKGLVLIRTKEVFQFYWWQFQSLRILRKEPLESFNPGAHLVANQHDGQGCRMQYVRALQDDTWVALTNPALVILLDDEGAHTLIQDGLYTLIHDGHFEG